MIELSTLTGIGPSHRATAGGASPRTDEFALAILAIGGGAPAAPPDSVGGIVVRGERQECAEAPGNVLPVEAGAVTAVRSAPPTAVEVVVAPPAKCPTLPTKPGGSEAPTTATALGAAAEPIAANRALAGRDRPDDIAPSDLPRCPTIAPKPTAPRPEQVGSDQPPPRDAATRPAIGAPPRCPQPDAGGRVKADVAPQVELTAADVAAASLPPLTSGAVVVPETRMPSRATRADPAERADVVDDLTLEITPPFVLDSTEEAEAGEAPHPASQNDVLPSSAGIPDAPLPPAALASAAAMPPVTASAQPHQAPSAIRSTMAAPRGGDAKPLPQQQPTPPAEIASAYHAPPAALGEAATSWSNDAEIVPAATAQLPASRDEDPPRDRRTRPARRLDGTVSAVQPDHVPRHVAARVSAERQLADPDVDRAAARSEIETRAMALRSGENPLRTAHAPLSGRAAASAAVATPRVDDTLVTHAAPMSLTTPTAPVLTAAHDDAPVAGPIPGSAREPQTPRAPIIDDNHPAIENKVERARATVDHHAEAPPWRLSPSAVDRPAGAPVREKSLASTPLTIRNSVELRAGVSGTSDAPQLAPASVAASHSSAMAAAPIVPTETAPASKPTSEPARAEASQLPSGLAIAPLRSPAAHSVAVSAVPPTSGTRETFVAPVTSGPRPVSRKPMATDATTPAPAASQLRAAPLPQPAAVAFASAMFAAAAQPEHPIKSERDTRFAPPLAPAELSAHSALTTAAPAPVAAAHETPLDTRRDGWMHDMIEHIVTMREESGASETRIRLAPDALGGVDVTIRQDGDGAVQVALNADTATGRTLLAEAAPRLAELAESRGLKLGGNGVDGGQAGQQSNTRDERRPAASAAATIAASTPTDPTAPGDGRIA